MVDTTRVALGPTVRVVSTDSPTTTESLNKHLMTTLRLRLLATHNLPSTAGTVGLGLAWVTMDAQALPSPVRNQASEVLALEESTMPLDEARLDMVSRVDRLSMRHRPSPAVLRQEVRT